MKVLGIVGSPVKGNTETLVKEMVKKLGGGDIILLRERKILFCDGCLKCEKTGQCPVKDGMQDVYRKMESADVIVFGTPSYYDNVSGLMKNLIDRSVPYYLNKKLKGKKAAIITVGSETAGKAVPPMKAMCVYNGMRVIGSVSAESHSGKIKDKQKVEAKMKEIAKKAKGD